MFQLDTIIITQFKNYGFSSFVFSERVIGVCGLNGRGKTNLLDAIYYSCFTKSYFSRADALNIQFDKDGFRIESLFEKKAGRQKVIFINKGTGKKELTLNDAPYEKFVHHIGHFPAVMIAPDDIELITGSSEGRRRFIDTILCQVDADFMQQLITYNKVLQQRNGLLKQFAEQGKTDWPLLEILDEQLMKPGNIIYAKRKAFTGLLIPLVTQFYRQITGNHETVSLQYDSQLNDQDFESLINQLRQKDFALQRTNGGIHKDDIDILLNGQVFKNIASQGQRKSLLFALKLAEFELLKKDKGFAPLLLLDDVFEKLDDKRMQHLLQWVCNENNGQVFITDTHRSRLEEAFEMLNVKYQLIEL